MTINIDLYIQYFRNLHEKVIHISKDPSSTNGFHPFDTIRILRPQPDWIWPL